MGYWGLKSRYFFSLWKLPSLVRSLLKMKFYFFCEQSLAWKEWPPKEPFSICVSSDFFCVCSGMFSLTFRHTLYRMPLSHGKQRLSV